MADEGQWGWADTAQFLIDQGHAWADVRDMTFDQLRLFTEAAGRQYRRRLRDTAIATRAAGYDKDSWSKFLKTFDD